MYRPNHLNLGSLKAVPIALLLSLFPLMLHGASATQKLQLYLPITQAQYPTMLNDLRASLQGADLGAIEVVTAEHWNSYQNAIRRGRVAAFYAAPHFLAWSIRKHNFVPLARTRDSLKYVVASRRGDPAIFEINDLNRQVVCAERALNLDYLLVNSAFENRLYSAQTKIVESVLKEMNNDQSQCAAFSVSDHLFKAKERLTPGKFIRLQQGASYNNYGFSIHPRLARQHGARLQKFLLLKSTQTILKPLLEKSSESTDLVKTNRSDYPLSYTKVLQKFWRDARQSSG